jgi:hypothetical protein
MFTSQFQVRLPLNKYFSRSFGPKGDRIFLVALTIKPDLDVLPNAIGENYFIAGPCLINGMIEFFNILDYNIFLIGIVATRQ